MGSEVSESRGFHPRLLATNVSPLRGVRIIMRFAFIFIVIMTFALFYLNLIIDNIVNKPVFFIDSTAPGVVRITF